ncbi:MULTISPECIES: 1-phosphofructokinase family hexose kinase [unclassified Actinotalea]|uniref:1-phosphofructokinase family hexose kinase n=1 Tax=unclassified Actinotalea TaxID=2638618 RepID=UPI0015F3F23E|nr:MULTISPECIES: PfkB family carbohydrate kinase [unclassified Actinotalea]
MTDEPRVCVLALTSLLTVTVEDSAHGSGPEIHVHPGGQGLWLARMASVLGARVVACGPFAGETGAAAQHLAAREGVDLRATRYDGSNGAYVHDRRSRDDAGEPGEREELAAADPTPLGRHELDDLFGTLLVEALEADVVALTGADPPDTVPADFLARVARDLRRNGSTVVADLSGDAALAVVAEGLDVLKMSHSEMVDAGLAEGPELAQLLAGARAVLAGEHADDARSDDAEDEGRGRVGAMVVSRAAEGTLVVTREGAWQVTAPPVSTVDHRGAGDSLTAAVTVGLGRGLELLEAVRLGAAAGALNVTRRGLATGHRDQIERFVERVTVEPLEEGAA